MRVGLIGLGGVGEVHLEAYNTLEGIEVIAGAEIDAERLEKISNKFKFNPYSDYTEMLSSEDLDLICVLTPCSTHPEVVEYCASKGVHILCEKPLAVDMEGANRIIAATEKNNIKFCYGSTYRFLPAIMKAQEIILSGQLGEIQYLCEESLGGAGPESFEHMGYQHYPKGGIGGSGMGLVDHGIHLIDVFSWIMSSPITSVYGRGNISGEKPKTEFMHMIFENGAMGHLVYNDCTYSTTLPGEGMFGWGGAWSLKGYTPPGEWQEHPGCIRIYGTKGALRIFHYPNKLYMSTEKGIEQVKLLDRPAPENFAMQMEEFISNIKNDTKITVTGQAGIDALKALLATYKSFEEKGVVEIK